MRKLLFTLSFIVFAFCGVQAQDVKGSESKAIAYLEKGDLSMAKAEIEAFFANPKNVKKIAKSKPWVTKARVYQAIALSDGEGTEEALKSLVSCYNKVSEIENGKETPNYLAIFGYAEALKNNILPTPPLKLELYGALFNKGVEYYNADDYPNAISVFEKVLLVMPSDTNSIVNTIRAAYGLDTPDYAKVKKYSMRLIEMDYNDAFPFAAVTEVDMKAANELMENAQNAADSAKAKEGYESVLAIVSKGREKFPDNENLVSQQMNLYLKLDKTDEAIASIEAAAEKAEDQDEKKRLYFNLGVLYDQAENMEKSEESYEKAISADPDYYDARFNLGAMYYGVANKKIVAAEDFKDMYGKFTDPKGKVLEEEAKEIFAKAIPHFEKSDMLNPGDEQTMQVLHRMYSFMDMKDKAKAISKKIEQISGLTE